MIAKIEKVVKGVRVGCFCVRLAKKRIGWGGVDKFLTILRVKKKKTGDKFSEKKAVRLGAAFKV